MHLNTTVMHVVTVACMTCHRMKESTLHGLFSLSLFPNIPSAVELAKVTHSHVNVPQLFLLYIILSKYIEMIKA